MKSIFLGGRRINNKKTSAFSGKGQEGSAEPMAALAFREKNSAGYGNLTRGTAQLGDGLGAAKHLA